MVGWKPGRDIERERNEEEKQGVRVWSSVCQRLPSDFPSKRLPLTWGVNVGCLARGNDCSTLTTLCLPAVMILSLAPERFSVQ